MPICLLNTIYHFKKRCVYKKNLKMSETKNCPRDAQVMAAILKDMGISEYEPRVVNLMLEFTYRKKLYV